MEVPTTSKDTGDTPQRGYRSRLPSYGTLSHLIDPVSGPKVPEDEYGSSWLDILNDRDSSRCEEMRTIVEGYCKLISTSVYTAILANQT